MKIKKILASVGLIAILAVAVLPSAAFAFDRYHGGWGRGGYGFSGNLGNLLVLDSLFNRPYGYGFGGGFIGSPFYGSNLGNLLILNQLFGRGRIF